MSKILIPANKPEDWQQFLAEPDKQWRTGYSAKAMAHCWQEADGIPPDVAAVLEKSNDFQGIEAMIVIPEHKVALPGGTTASQNDAWLLARAGDDVVSIAVEGKVSEPFGETLEDWGVESSPGKKIRYEYLCDLLNFDQLPDGSIRYQLLHRTASAIIEAKRFNAVSAVMLVHSFSQSDESFTDYERFVELFGVSADLNSVSSAGERSGINLYFAWVRGDKRFLEV